MIRTMTVMPYRGSLTLMLCNWTMLCPTLWPKQKQGANRNTATNQKHIWCPELSHLRDRKRFWWRLWNDNDRPRAGAVNETYKYIKKVFRRRTRQCVDRSVNNKYQKLNVMLKNRKLSAFWNVIKQRRITKVKSSLCHRFWWIIW